MIAVTIHLASPPTVSPGLTASDIVAICSVLVAVLALVVSIATAAAQRRHNILLARPHLDVDLGVETSVLSVRNHGPGIARIRSLVAVADSQTFNFLEDAGLQGFRQWLAEGLHSSIRLESYLLKVGSSFAPNHSEEIIRIKDELSEENYELLLDLLKTIDVYVTYTCIFENTYSEHVEFKNTSTPNVDLLDAQTAI